MALTSAVTSNIRVSEGLRGLFTLTAHLTVTDDVLGVVIDNDYSAEYSETQTTLVSTRAKLAQKMQDAINAYKREVALVSQAQRDAAITWFNSNLTL